jgi:hypothetical protein
MGPVNAEPLDDLKRATSAMRARIGMEITMGMFYTYSLPLLIAGTLFVSGCVTSQVDEKQKLTGTQQDTPSCLSKWVAAGNNGAKADRYFQVSC